MASTRSPIRTLQATHGSYLDIDDPVVSPGQVVEIDVPLIWAGPSSTFASLAVMPAGAQAILTGQVNGLFYELTWNSMLGWAHSDYLTLVSEPPLPTPTNTPVGPSPTATTTSSPTATAMTHRRPDPNSRTNANTWPRLDRHGHSSACSVGNRHGDGDGRPDRNRPGEPEPAQRREDELPGHHHHARGRNRAAAGADAVGIRQSAVRCP